jgi:hypothetical protein
MRDDKTVDMAQKDGSYNAVLKRCRASSDATNQSLSARPEVQLL